MKKIAAKRRLASMETEAKRLTSAILFWRGAISATSLRRKANKTSTDSSFFEASVFVFYQCVSDEFSLLRFLPPLFLILFLGDCNKYFRKVAIICL